MRTIKNFNSDWTFIKDTVLDISNWNTLPELKGTKITLPHTWNAQDGQDGGNDYYRGTCWYIKKFEKPETDNRNTVYLEFRGVNASAGVYINGIKAAEHSGGYSTFRVNITAYLQKQNILAVSADNGINTTVYPQKADFTFYGGIYRDVYLISVPENHFDLDSFGSPGIQVTPEINGTSAVIHIKTSITLAAESQNKTEPYHTTRNCIVRYTINGTEKTECSVQNGEADANITIHNVHLWNGRLDPYLYTVQAELTVDGFTEDTVETQFGCRTYSFTKNGFFLNGRKYPLHGVSRHQDRRSAGNALTKEMHKEDMILIADMGVTAIRLAHYQHDQYFYNLCDEYGMIVWAEIPYITKHMDSGYENTISQMTELISQNYNHPSIICWGLSNEITVGGLSDRLLENNRALNDLCHKMDPSRLTAAANCFILESESQMAQLPDLCGYNLYYGWYAGTMKDNDAWFDSFHKKFPDKPVVLSEYGADANYRLQTAEPVKNDYTEQYQCLFHEHILAMLSSRPYICASFCWNMFDFAADGRDEGGEHGINQKGLVSFDRSIKKDSYYLYKAFWSSERFVHICGSRYINRPECVTEIKVYSNCTAVSLTVNGVFFSRQNSSHIFIFSVPFTTEQKLTITAAGSDTGSDCTYCDEITVIHTAKADPSYTLPENSVQNWFEKEGIRKSDSSYSIKDTVGDISRTAEGRKIAAEVMKIGIASRGDVAEAASEEIQINEEMQKIISNTPLDVMMRQIGSRISREKIIEINNQLQKIKK